MAKGRIFRSLDADCVLLTLILLVFTQSSAGELAEPIRDAKRLSRAQRDFAVRVNTAKVLYIDPLLERDFPFLKGRSFEAQAEWLLSNVGYISLGQVFSNTEQVNEWISVSPSDRRAPLRPEDAGRVLVYEVSDGLLDVKGAGAIQPRNNGYNGLKSTASALRELIFEKAVSQMLKEQGVNASTVGSYAVIDWGFYFKDKNGKRIRAGAVVRQAHARRPVATLGRPNHFAPDALALEVERALRQYGMTSSGEKWAPGVSAINVQSGLNNEIFDFDSYLVGGDRRSSIYRYETADLLSKNPGLAALPLAKASSSNFPIPDQGLRLSASLWGYSDSGEANPERDNVSLRSEALIEDYMSGRKSRDAIESFVRSYSLDAPAALPETACAAVLTK